ncbi:tRNA-splicing endonuclease subunit Sen15 [Podospora fimiseda]|uniref:tRNA-splicing endonuclease subunit Sen15 n=1 Tax=Podospora fimiseda TaxID=252190 RepID=A0AAN7GUY5_9PEZI|nr:tRNA-splicing endonuclease subunit Sen15 [Podospora fimiseda]
MVFTQPLDALAKIVLDNLKYQHDWTEVYIHTQSNLTRPLIYGLPPKRLYIHPDEQIETIKAEKDRNNRIPQKPENEWVLPLYLAEKWTPAQFAAVFDAIKPHPPSSDIVQETDNTPWMAWRGSKRGKRILLATVQDDSTVTYYWLHDGLVKPRQN